MDAMELDSIVECYDAEMDQFRIDVSDSSLVIWLMIWSVRRNNGGFLFS
jgi:hypothetical protein